MASAKFQGKRVKIDGEIAENHEILVDHLMASTGWWRVFLRRGYFRAPCQFFALVLKGFCKFLSCFDRV